MDRSVIHIYAPLFQKGYYPAASLGAAIRLIGGWPVISLNLVLFNIEFDMGFLYAKIRNTLTTR